MRIKLDENLPRSAKQVLADHGHDVDTVADEGLAGSADPTVVAEATTADRLLITLDRGLGDLRRYPPGSRAGIIVVRIADQSAAAARAAVTELLSTSDLKDLRGAVTVAQRGLLRVHRPSPRPANDEDATQ